MEGKRYVELLLKTDAIVWSWTIRYSTAGYWAHSHEPTFDSERAFYLIWFCIWWGHTKARGTSDTHLESLKSVQPACQGRKGEIKLFKKLPWQLKIVAALRYNVSSEHKNTNYILRIPCWPCLLCINSAKHILPLQVLQAVLPFLADACLASDDWFGYLQDPLCYTW